MEMSFQIGDILHYLERKIASDRICEVLATEKWKVSDLLFVAFVTDTDGMFMNPTSLVVDDSMEVTDSFQYDLQTRRCYFQRRRRKRHY